MLKLLFILSTAALAYLSLDDNWMNELLWWVPLQHRPLLATTIFVLFGFVIFLGILSFLKSFIDGPLAGQSKSSLKKTIKEYEKVINSMNEELVVFERIKKKNFAEVTPHARERFHTAEGIKRSLERRSEEAKELLQSNHRGDLQDAYALMSSPLRFDNNHMEELIHIDPIQPIPIDKVSNYIADLMEQLRKDFDPTHDDAAETHVKEDAEVEN